MNRLVYGVGINDASYKVYHVVNGKKVACNFYTRWKNMLKRCYSHEYKIKYKSYEECSVCDEWLIFSNFKKWMESQDWFGKDLDKDIITETNKIYSPEHCAFIDKSVNNFITDSAASRGIYLIGARKHMYGKFESMCGNPISGEREYLGHFETEIEAHHAWLLRKHELACQLADLQTDERVAKALRLKYAAKVRQGGE